MDKDKEVVWTLSAIVWESGVGRKNKRTKFNDSQRTIDLWTINSTSKSLYYRKSPQDEKMKYVYKFVTVLYRKSGGNLNIEPIGE